MISVILRWDKCGVITNLVKSTRRLQIEKYMDSFTDKELSLMESLAMHDKANNKDDSYDPHYRSNFFVALGK